MSSGDGVLLVDTAPDGDASYDYDLLVIGGGSGGLSAAKRAAEHGAKVALCDFVTPSTQGTTWGLGGTCLNVGCIPKKLMHTAALHGEVLSHIAPSFGWSGVGSPVCEWSTLKANITEHIKRVNWQLKGSLQQKGVTYFNARASFVDPHTVDAVNKSGKVNRVSARRIIIATGGRPNMLDIPGCQEYAITSDDIFKLSRDPGKTLIVGASYIALECAGFLTGIGRPTTVMMRSIPLRGFDQEMAEQVVDHMKRCGTSFLRGWVPTAITKTAADSAQLTVTYRHLETGKTESDTFDSVLVAVGRTPGTLSINTEAAGVKILANGKVVVDAAERTSAPHIYAVGDIVEGGLEVTPVAIQAGRLLANRLYAGGTQLMIYSKVPTTVFTPLEYGCVGLTEADAVKRYGSIAVSRTMFRPLEWVLPRVAADTGDSKAQCCMKILINRADEDRIVGFHLTAPHAGEITQGVAVALQCGATKADFERTIGIHPTMAEAMTTIRVVEAGDGPVEAQGC